MLSVGQDNNTMIRRFFMFVSELISIEEVKNWQRGDNILINTPTGSREK